ncbi:ed9bf85f-3414-443c-9f84-c09971e7b59b-CDS [Sclerotinia trifoliorum]|uniref:Ed9bf85f-3414-443c-9f84-c09971e7b59b-CDS n=1 Tax=Sclerotinia trifoliorum TaxID=28548 RepID=A0A8H2VXP3_9HELO|nr:ed9bf85f-3414-443c-9f84-c09971e7b59b-CDS [Sclerotinia trifoliorum]
MSSNKSSPSNTSYAQRPSKFAEHIFDKTQEKINNRLYLVEKRERERKVVLAFNQWKQKYPKQCNKLDWEASYHDVDEEYDENDENDAEPIQVHLKEDEPRAARESEGKGGKPLATPAMKSRREKVAKRIADAKMAMCFGSVTPEE